MTALSNRVCPEPMISPTGNYPCWAAWTDQLFPSGQCRNSRDRRNPWGVASNPRIKFRIGQQIDVIGTRAAPQGTPKREIPHQQFALASYAEALIGALAVRHHGFLAYAKIERDAAGRITVQDTRADLALPTRQVCGTTDAFLNFVERG